MEWLPEPPDELIQLSRKVSNWYRWGPDDQLGTLNHITDECRARAAHLVRRGAVFPVGIAFDHAGPQSGQIGRVNPIHTMTATGCDHLQRMDLGGGARFTDDFIVMPLQCATHWDALAHVYYDGVMYNGADAKLVDSQGARRCGIDRVYDRFVTRGVLLDMAAADGVDCLPADRAISVADLERAEAHFGVRLGAGDVLLLRTGLMGARRAAGDWSAFAGMQPGLHYETALWLHEREVAAVAADNAAVEHLGLSMPGVMLPFHMLALRDMGLHLGEYFDFEDLARDCAGDGSYETLLVASPLPVTGGVGGPVSPLVLK
jgi:kynurenine formamidase